MEYRYRRRPRTQRRARLRRPEKEKLLTMLAARTRAEVAADLGVSRHTITNWLIAYNVRQPRVNQPVTRVARLIDEMADPMILWARVPLSSAEGINGVYRGMVCQI